MNAMRSIEGPKRSANMIAAHILTLVTSFFVGIAAGGTLWVATIYFLEPAPTYLSPTSVILLASSFGITTGFIIAKIKLRGQFWMKYTTLTFVTGGFLSALVGILLISLALWAYSVAGSGG
jgi:hypothetical protein